MQQPIDIYQIVENYINNTNRSIFLTGKAGTGKTTLLQKIQQTSTKQIVVAAPTGVAAINAGGTTLHSLFQLPFTPFLPTEEMQKQLISSIQMRKQRRRVIYEMDLLIIDEVSMVRADLLDAIDTLLRHLRYKPNTPFGGVQLLLIGDLFQLAPVVKESEWKLLKPHYKGIYFFHSKAFQQLNTLHFELDKIFRQQDKRFIHILNQVRNNQITTHELQTLNQRYQPNFKNKEKNYHIILTTHNARAEEINNQHMDELWSREYTYQAQIQGEFLETNYPTEAKLILKKGARVMFVKNDNQQPRQFYNGQIGKITAITQHTITVESENEKIEVKPMEWENIHYETDQATRTIKETIIGTFKQYPLRLAWAITIHKSQGLTFDKVLIDAEAAFAYGQVYVALSRCRSLEGIILMSPINTHSLENDKEILAFEKTKTPTENIQQTLKKEQNNYLLQLTYSIFDFDIPLKQLQRIKDYTQEKQAHLIQINNEYLTNTQNQLTQYNNISQEFKKQITHIHPQTNYLQQRLQAANNFFQQQLKENLLQLKPPFLTDNKTIAQEADELVDNLHTTLHRKIAFMQAIAEEWSSENYFAAKNQEIPSWGQTTLATIQQATTTETNNIHYPQLFRKLQTYRIEKAKTQQIPPYMVLSTKALIEITNNLPQKEKELLKIKGIGKTKVEKYGKDIIAIIDQFTAENQLEGFVAQKMFFNQEKKNKK